MNKHKTVYIIVGFIFMMIATIVVSLIPQQLNEALGLRPPNFNHLLGTDQLGRDFLLRL
ncbi:TPA: ABC transporter permease, partial [Pseudomonas aeruginosa]|nr:ABC transporter permease [Pseudomonas aeruginosa]